MEPSSRRARIEAIVDELTRDLPSPHREQARQLYLGETEYQVIDIVATSPERRELFEEWLRLSNEEGER